MRRSMESSISYLVNATVIGIVGAVVGFVVYYRIQCSRIKYDLYGKVVCITGANGGLGSALAEVFADRGAKLILTGRTMGALLQLQNSLLEKHVNLESALYELDLEKLEEIPRIGERIKASFGAVDVLVLNAGISSRGSVLETDFDVVKKAMDVNFFGPVLLTKCLAPIMMGKQSAIVAVSSLQGKIAIPFRCAYASSKHAFQAFFDSFRAELAGAGAHMNVLVVSPAYIRTSLSLNALGPDGKPYGKMDSMTASGMDPRVVAERIVRGVEQKESELIISSLFYKAVVCLRVLSPSLFFRLMTERAKKVQINTK